MPSLILTPPTRPGIRPRSGSVKPPRIVTPLSYSIQTLDFGSFQSECSILLDASSVDNSLSHFERFRDLRFEAPARGDMLRASTLVIQTGYAGLGMIASDGGEGIKAGFTILIEHPILVAPMDTGPDVYAFDALLNALGDRYRASILALSGSARTAVQDLDPGRQVENIFRANALPIELFPGFERHHNNPKYGAVFLKISRCNHSCGPNALWKWDPGSFTLCLEAMRDIAPGEEVTIQYPGISLYSSREDRQYQLSQQYGFLCQCAHCHPTSSQSDEARIYLSQFWKTSPSFDEWCGDESLADDLLIKLHQHAMELGQAEGIQVLDSTLKHIDATAMCYGVLGQTELFRAWMYKSKKARVGISMGLLSDEDLEHIIALDLWLNDPTSFPLWGWRARKSDEIRVPYCRS